MSYPPSQREQIILDEVQKWGSVSIKNLADKLGVSAMTIHRDVNKLVEERAVVKSHGEVLPVKVKSDDEGCAMCRKPISDRTAYLLILANGEQKRTCCAHCGLMLQMQMDDVWQPMATDFLHGHIISASQAFFVLHSDLSICCVPSVLSFGSEAEAVKFTKGFGGTVTKMDQVIHHFQTMGTTHAWQKSG
ncbi:MAG: DeoR family transcriptional regulator [Anaerolineales bacterium]|nr:DeoR family transcriptional regulator [Anaerolineales bacterium]